MQLAAVAQSLHRIAQWIAISILNIAQRSVPTHLHNTIVSMYRSTTNKADNMKASKICIPTPPTSQRVFQGGAHLIQRFGQHASGQVRRALERCRVCQLCAGGHATGSPLQPQHRQLDDRVEQRAGQRLQQQCPAPGSCIGKVTKDQA